MQHYAEDEMGRLRRRLEAQVLGWPKVKAKRMLGCPSYQADGKLFATLVTGGVVLARVDDGDWKALTSQFPVSPFRAGKRVLKNWARVKVQNEDDLERLMPFVRRSYQVVLEEW